MTTTAVIVGAPTDQYIAVRDVLGRAHYERMRRGMAPALHLPPWADLSAGIREAYSARLDYVIVDLLPLLAVEPVWRVGAPNPEQDIVLALGDCCRATLGRWGCTRAPEHMPPHAADDGELIVAVWDQVGP